MKERYESYKDSGVAWIGQVPAGWEVVKLRKYLRLCSERGHQDEQLLSVTREQGVIIRNTESKEENHNFIPADLSNYKYVRAGQFAINKMKAWQGSYGVSPYNGIVSPAYYVCDIANIDPHFFSIAIRSRAYVPFFSQLSKGIRVDQWDLSTDALKSVPFIEPPLPEQRAIAGYLDERCAAIDAYVASLEREAGLARELKQALIARAVTRGLDPNTPMRDSGIPWIGQVPEGWEVETFGKHFTFGKGLPITKADLVPEGIAVLSYGQIHAKYNKGTTISDNMVRYVSSDFISTNPKSLLNKGDYVFADTSEDIEGSGNFGFNDYADDIFAGYHTIIARPTDLAYPKYYAYLFQSRGWKSQVQSKVNGVKVYSITKEILKGTSILIPPLPEQRAITSYLDARCAAIDAYVASLEREAGLARELKQREIADAVTGKVKITA